MTPEGQIKLSICQYLAARGVFFWVQQAGKIPGRINRSKYLRNGISDILGVLRGGRALAIEVKAPKGVVSPEQEEFLALVNRSGGLGFVARSVEDVQKHLGGNG
jgi:hypothetical protein